MGYCTAMDRGWLESVGLGIVGTFLACCAGLLCCSCGGATFEAGPVDVDAGGEQADAGRDAVRTDAAPAADVPIESATTCTCGAGSCWYPHAKVVALSPGKPTARFVAAVRSPAYPDHDPVWFDLDVSAFPSGGSIAVSGQMGGGGADGTTFLVDECATFPASGAYSAVENVGNVPPGTTWSFGAYAFTAGTTVLHLGSEGSWYNAGLCPSCTPGATNTNTITVTVQ